MKSWFASFFASVRTRIWCALSMKMDPFIDLGHHNPVRLRVRKLRYISAYKYNIYIYKYGRLCDQLFWSAVDPDV